MAMSNARRKLRSSNAGTSTIDLYMAKSRSRSDWEVKQAVTVALPTVIRKPGHRHD